MTAEKEKDGQGENTSSAINCVRTLVSLARNLNELPGHLRETAASLMNHLADTVVNSSVPERIEASEVLTRMKKRFPKSADVVNDLLKKADDRRHNPPPNGR
jgi:hypothetical protein